MVREHYAATIGYEEMPATEFATRLGVTGSAYRRYERGEVDPPTSVLSAIREATGVSLDFLVCGQKNGYDGLLSSYRRPKNRIPLGLRLRWARETQEPSLEIAAHWMSVTPDQWRRYEEDLDPLPVAKAQEFAHRFSVTLDFLYQGRLAGMKDHSPWVFAELVRQHPELQLALDKLHEAERRAAHIDRGDRRHTDGGSRLQAIPRPDHETAEPTLISPFRRV